MRMAFGLVSLLVVIAIILVAFSMYTAPVAKQGKKTQDQARQISGRDEEGKDQRDDPHTTAEAIDAALHGHPGGSRRAARGPDSPDRSAPGLGGGTAAARIFGGERRRVSDHGHRPGPVIGSPGYSRR